MLMSRDTTEARLPGQVGCVNDQKSGNVMENDYSCYSYVILILYYAYLCLGCFKQTS